MKVSYTLNFVIKTKKKLFCVCNKKMENNTKLISTN